MLFSKEDKKNKPTYFQNKQFFPLKVYFLIPRIDITI